MANIVGRLGHIQIDWILDPSLADIDGMYLPNKEDFFQSWKLLNVKGKRVVNACVLHSKLEDIFEHLPEIPYQTFNKMVRDDPEIIRAIIYGRCLNQPSKVAVAMYLETVIGNEKSRKYHFDDIQKLIMSDREHLKELAKDINFSGDGKREILKELVAYGMQTKEHEAAVIDQATGAILQPAVYTIADARIALLSLQEANKMDHEYMADDTATSSIESQAKRVKRLKERMSGNLLKQVNAAATKDAKRIGGIAKKVAKREIKEMELDGKDLK